MDHRRMLDWADRQFVEFEKAERAWQRKKPYDVRLDQDLKTGEILSRLVVADWIERPSDTSFNVGDILHNQRVAIDYALYAVALAENREFTLAHPKKISFPICADVPKDWNGQPLGRLKAWAGDDTIRVIKSLQRKDTSDASDAHLLVLLDQLDGPHKHRELLDTEPFIRGGSIRAKHVGGPEPILDRSSVGPEGPLVDGTVLARLRFRSLPDLPNTEVYVDTEAVFDIAFHKDGPVGLKPVSDTIQRFSNHIRNVVFPALEKRRADFP